MPVEVLFVGVPVADFAAAVRWYERLLGREADIVVKDDEVMWRIADAAWLYVVLDPGRAGRALVALAVTDLDATIAELEARGLRAAPIETVGDARRKAPYADPDGNVIALIEVAPNAPHR